MQALRLKVLLETIFENDPTQLPMFSANLIR
jgi:hypothetical protein